MCFYILSCAMVFMITLIIHCIFLGIVQGDYEVPSLNNIESVLNLVGAVEAASDGRAYICSESRVIAYGPDLTVAWLMELDKNITCQQDVAPIFNPDTKQVYVATGQYVQEITVANDVVGIRKLYTSPTNTSGNALGVYPVTGLALGKNSAATFLYVNTGIGGLYAVTLDGIPRWSIGGVAKNTTSDLMKPQFDPRSFCNYNMSQCYFHFSPAVDHCDGTLYVASASGWLFAIATWKPYIRWRYNLNLEEPYTHAGVTAGNNGYVYVATVIRSTVYAFVAQTGEVAWTVKVGPFSTLSCFPRVDTTGWVIIGSLDGNLYAISPDGSTVQKYLSDTAFDSVIQYPPYLSCDGGVVYAAVIEVSSKTISYFDGTPVASYIDAKGVWIYQMNVNTGVVYWRNLYPEAGVLDPDSTGYLISSSLILALVSQNLTEKGLCTNAEYGSSMGCLVHSSFPKLPDYDTSRLKGYYLGIPFLFLLIAVSAICIYDRIDRTFDANQRKKRRQRRKDIGVPKHPGTLVRKKESIEESLGELRVSLLKNPDSTKIQSKLRNKFQELISIKSLLSRFMEGGLYEDVAAQSEGEEGLYRPEDLLVLNRERKMSSKVPDVGVSEEHFNPGLITNPLYDDGIQNYQDLEFANFQPRNTLSNNELQPEILEDPVMDQNIQDIEEANVNLENLQPSLEENSNADVNTQYF